MADQMIYLFALVSLCTLRCDKFTPVYIIKNNALPIKATLLKLKNITNMITIDTGDNQTFFTIPPGCSIKEFWAIHPSLPLNNLH